MSSIEWVREIVAWLGTYALHSTLFLGAAWLLCALRPPRVNRNRERLWKLALVGGLVSASLQITLGTPPLLGRIEWRPEPGLVERTTRPGQGMESTPPSRSPLDVAPVEKARPGSQRPLVSSGAELAGSVPAAAATTAPSREAPAPKPAPAPETEFGLA